MLRRSVPHVLSVTGGPVGATLDTDAKFDSQFRPLLSATIAAGVIALGILDFAASDWNGFGTESRAMISVAARTAFLVFVVNTVVLVVAYLVARLLGPILTFLINLFGVVVFMIGTWLIGALLSTALGIASPQGALPPDNVQAFLGFVGLGVIGLVVAIVATLLVGLARRTFKSANSNNPSEEETTDAET